MGRSYSSRRRRIAAIISLGLVTLVVGPSRFSLFPLVTAARAETPALVSSSDTIDLQNLQARFQAVADQVSPAVVAISASTTADLSPESLRSEEMNGEKLQMFLSKTTRMVGTGFIISADGYILTNDHVIDEAEQLWITTDDKKVYPALVIGSDPRGDLAVLKIPARDLPTVHFGDGKVKRGQWSVAIGNPYGLSAEGEMCMSVGIVSAVNRSLPKLSDKENRLYTNLIQTTAQINPGNSGGPLFDLNGNVIGINTAVVMPQKSINGIGFAMPIDAHLLAAVEDLKQGKEIVYGYLGVIVSTPTDRDRRQAGLKEATGARVDSVEADSPAAGGKLRENDLIVAIGNDTVLDSDSFVQIVGSSPVTRPVDISIIRNGKPANISVTLCKRPMPVAAVTRDNQRLRWGGMLLGPAPVAGSANIGLMVFDIDPASPFTKLGIHEGAIIKSVGGKPVTGITQLQGIINDTPIEHCEIGLATAVVPVER